MAVKGTTRTSLIGLLGYGGAAAAIAATGIALGDVTGTGVRATVDVATVAVLLLVGVLVGNAADDSFHRMRSVFWFVALFSWADLMGIAVGTEGLDLDLKEAFVVGALGTAAPAAVLWTMERRSLQLLGLYASVEVAAVALVYSDTRSAFFGTIPDFRGPAWVTLLLGVLSFALGAAGFVKPRRTAMVLGSLGAIYGALFTDVSLLAASPSTGAIVFALAVSVVVLLTGDLLGERAPAGIGIVGTFLLTVALVADQVTEQAAGIAVLVIGLAMLAGTVLLVRASEPPAPSEVPQAPEPRPEVPAEPPPPPMPPV